jgi:hypothetical protein
VFSGIFSAANQRFASAYVRPQQVATLSAVLVPGGVGGEAAGETLRFRFFEATRVCFVCTVGNFYAIFFI